jgi:hypothetical protein
MRPTVKVTANRKARGIENWRGKAKVLKRRGQTNVSWSPLRAVWYAAKVV